MALSLSGLASGVDTSSLVEQLMAAERAPQARMRLRESALQARQDALRDVVTRLRNLQNAAKELGAVTAWADTQTVDTSDATKLGVRRLSGAAPGGHEIAVTTLARAEQRSYAFASGAGSLTLTTSTGTTSISLSATDDGQAAADKINAAAGAPVYAVFVKDPGGDTTKDRLVLTRRDTGRYDASALTVGGLAWTSSETIKDGVDASFTVDGEVKSSKTNVITSAVPGLELTLKATGTTTVSVGVPGPDAEAVKSRVRAFVDQYNSTVDFIRGKLAEKRIPNAATSDDARKGVLFADTQLNGILSQLRNAISDAVPGLAGSVTRMSDIGVSTGTASGSKSSANALAGKLVVDDAKLTEALQNKRLDVKSFLTDAVSGIGSRLSALLDPVAKVGGVIEARATQAGQEVSRIDAQLLRMEERLAERAERLKAQFAAMEAAMANSQAQGQWLAGQLAAL